MKEIIIHLVSMRNGIKSVPLVLAVMEKVNPQRFSIAVYDKCLDELVKDGTIRELEYIDPDHLYRVKSMYFSKGTIFMNLRGFSDRETTDQEVVSRKG